MSKTLVRVRDIKGMVTDVKGVVWMHDKRYHEGCQSYFKRTMAAFTLSVSYVHAVSASVNLANVNFSWIFVFFLREHCAVKSQLHSSNYFCVVAPNGLTHLRYGIHIKIQIFNFANYLVP